MESQDLFYTAVRRAETLSRALLRLQFALVQAGMNTALKPHWSKAKDAIHELEKDLDDAWLGRAER